MLLVGRKGVIPQIAKTDGTEAEYDSHFTYSALALRYTESIRARGGRGIDHIGTDVFDRQQEEQLTIASRKCHSGTYLFAPYLERLVPRGPARTPRVISVPILRDRVVLAQLKAFLDGPCAGCVERRLPNEFIRQLMTFSATEDLGRLGVVRADIQSFFDTIDQTVLLERLRTGVQSRRAINLVKRALQTPTSDAFVRRSVRNRHRNRTGVPQGLAISRLLASLYLTDFDAAMRGSALLYLRYVDDIVVLAPLDALDRVSQLLANQLSILGLELNCAKSYKGPATEPFEYLSYAMRLPGSSVREVNVEKFLRAVVAKFAAYRHFTQTKKHPTWMSPAQRRRAFIEELNDKITGAVSETRRYGWLAYFLEIDDFALLHRADNIIRGFFSRLPEFESEDLQKLKRLSRAYYEMKYSPSRGYIRNFNKIVTTSDRIEYLSRRGRLNPAEADQMTEGEILQLYDHVRARFLRELEMDVGFLY